jgi:chemotaxis protein MotB
MRTVKLLSLLFICSIFTLVNGCGPELLDLKIQNNIQRKQIAKLESQLQTDKIKIDQRNRYLQSAQDRANIDADALQKEIDALQENINRKNTLIAAMQQQLIFGGVQLPIELGIMLDDFAKTEKMVTYDPNNGIVKFSSDLLFDPGSDNLAPSAAETVKALARILNSEQGKKFDIIIAGHTDDMRIGRPATRAKHPTNWHLSAHRAISVLNGMTESKLAPKRISIRGFGEYRPIAPNKPKKKGNPQNRRVEIYVVPKGM